MLVRPIQMRVVKHKLETITAAVTQHIRLTGAYGTAHKLHVVDILHVMLGNKVTVGLIVMVLGIVT